MTLVAHISTASQNSERHQQVGMLSGRDGGQQVDHCPSRQAHSDGAHWPQPSVHVASRHDGQQKAVVVGAKHVPLERRTPLELSAESGGLHEYKTINFKRWLYCRVINNKTIVWEKKYGAHFIDTCIHSDQCARQSLNETGFQRLFHL